MTESDIKTVVVTTLNGSVKGKIGNSVFGDKIYSFHKIPFIKPALGRLRFKNPEPFGDWNGVLDGTIEPPQMSSLDTRTHAFLGQEDAVYLNAYTKNLNPKTLSPVIVFIHGGRFQTGTCRLAKCSPDYLLKKDVVFFSFSYRLGALGFLCFEDPKLNVPGNAGLKDQTMALKWIKDNAEKFGGDPNNITVIGSSAGAASVHHHLLSNLSKNLFHKAISISGAASCDFALQSNLDYGIRLARHFGWNESNETEEMLTILQNVPVNELLVAQDKILTDDERNNMTFFAFAPVIEPFVTEQCFLSDSISFTMQNAWGNQIPFLLGYNSEEGLFLYNTEKELNTAEYYEKNRDLINMVPSKINCNNMKKKEIAAGLKKLYYGTNKPDLCNCQSFVNMITDKLFIHGIHDAIKSRLNNLSAPTYFYRFNFENRFTKFRCDSKSIDIKGVSHSTGTQFFLKISTHDNDPFKDGTPENKMMKQMVGMWTSFALTGNPNCKEIEPVVWEPVNLKQSPIKLLNIAEEISYIDMPEAERIEGLNKIYGQFKTY